MNANNKNSFLLKFQSEVFFWIAVGVAAFVFGFYFYNFHGDLITTTNGEWGTFGDFVGGTLNPFFSFLSFIALLTTINLQRKELKASRKELKASTKQLKRTANAQEMAQDALAKQLETQSKQQFENTFFSLLDQHNKLLEFHQNDIARALHNIVIARRYPTLSSAKTDLTTYNASIGQYFRVLYQLLKLIANSIPNSNIYPDFSVDSIKESAFAPDEKMYSNIVRSFLNYDVTQLLAINCYCSSDQDTYFKFKLLIERYAFLEHMPFGVTGYAKYAETLTETKNHYDPKAFGNSQFI
ncbi:putative phage abortive infection protein [Methylophilus sp. UBA6697]|jgi:uncharacterized membrane protein|uniref:putative phage abortive infection protein n=1 Tax=Methylophilus sp. UBA6697 TaxID=1946902 RepID=UPI000EBB9963|nr:putative phage abortive infection protein [Methylophilus sp. UBA6697]HCU84862.1 hypothetical protein [Methylophilus sp.]